MSCNAVPVTGSKRSINMSTLRLIEHVYMYPVLYQLDHRDYKNTAIKDQIWDTIAVDMHESSRVLKKKWKNLRDSYIKYLTAQCATGPEKKPYETWKWSAHMERFRPFINSKLETDVLNQTSVCNEIELPTAETPGGTVNYNFSVQEETGVENDEGEQISPENVIQCVVSEQPQFQLRKRKVATETNTDGVKKSYESKKQKDLDETDHIMIGVAKSIKKLTKKRQIIARKQIVEIITALELEELEENIL